MCCQGRENGPYQTLVEFPVGQEVDFLCFLFSPPVWPQERSIKNSQCRKRKNKNEAKTEVKISWTGRETEETMEKTTHGQQKTNWNKKYIQEEGDQDSADPFTTSPVEGQFTMDYEPKKSKKVQ